MPTEAKIPALNEKPTTKEILRAFPFLFRFIYSAYPRGFLIWSVGGFLQIPLMSATVYATKSVIDAFAVHDAHAALM
jgi:hypothetical protein